MRRTFNVYKMQIMSSLDSAPDARVLNKFELSSGQKRNAITKREGERERKVKTQRMFRLIYMQISEGWKHKQFTHKHKYTREKQTHSRALAISKWGKLKYSILENAYKWSQFRGNAGYCFSLIDILKRMLGIWFFFASLHLCISAMCRSRKRKNLKTNLRACMQKNNHNLFDAKINSMKMVRKLLAVAWNFG